MKKQEAHDFRRGSITGSDHVSAVDSLLCEKRGSRRGSLPFSGCAAGILSTDRRVALP